MAKKNKRNPPQKQEAHVAKPKTPEPIARSRNVSLMPKTNPAQNIGEKDDYDEYEYERLARDKAGKGCLLAFLIALIAVVVIIIAGFIYVTNEIAGKGAHGPEASNTLITGTAENGKSILTISIVQGYGNARSIGGILKDNGLIGNSDIFRVYVRFLYDSSRKFKYGNFEVTAGMSYDEILEIVTNKQTARKEVKVTVPEGSTVMQFAAIVEAAGLCTAEEFIDAANNGDYSDLSFFGLIDYDPNTFMRAEGYLAPQTYNFFTDETPYNIVRKFYLYTEHNVFTKEVRARMEEMNLSLREVVTLASIVEEEAGEATIQPAVASVFLNRYRAPLDGTGLTRRTFGSDATFYYLRDWVSRSYGGEFDAIPTELKYAYLTSDNDANVREGITAGPISCPSKNAIEAVLWPLDTNYYYFLTDDYGKYYYAKTYAQHDVNNQLRLTANAKFKEDGGAIEPEGNSGPITDNEE